MRDKLRDLTKRKFHVISQIRSGARKHDWHRSSPEESIESGSGCEICWSNNHGTHECPLNAEQFVDPGEC